jgi:hypothetical protein
MRLGICDGAHCAVKNRKIEGRQIEWCSMTTPSRAHVATVRAFDNCNRLVCGVTPCKKIQVLGNWGGCVAGQQTEEQESSRDMVADRTRQETHLSRGD